MFARVRRALALAVLLLAPALHQEAHAAEPSRVFSVLELEGVDDVATVGPDAFLALSSTENVAMRVDGLGAVTRAAGTGRFGFSGDGGPADRARLWGPEDISATEDGGFLLADTANCRIRRVDPSGTIQSVAGSGPRDACDGFSGDGGPATAARLHDPRGVSSLPGGGFLISDSWNNRVRRVDANGTITTVAGSGAPYSPFPREDPRADPGYGGNADAARLVLPDAVANLADGGFLISDTHYPGLHHVGADGIIRPAATGFAVNPWMSEHGVFAWPAARGSIQWRHPDGSLRRIAGGRRDGYFNGRGDPALRTSLPDVSDVEPTADGGFLLATDDRVLFVAPPNTQRLGVAIARETLPALLRHTLRIRTTLPATAEVRLRRGRTTFRRQVGARRGLTSIHLPRGLRPGIYLARVTARTATGATARDSLPVLVGGRLPAQVAEFAIGESFPTGSADQGPYDTVGACRRFGTRRVDCAIVTWDPDELRETGCTRSVAAVLRRSGYLYVRPYRCGPRGRRLKGRPKWTRRAVQAPPPALP